MIKKFLLCVVMVGIIFWVGYTEHHYTRKDCEVVRVENGVARFEDECGFLWDWEIEENEYFEVGDFVDLKMNDNHSSGYTDDDVIKKVVFHD